MELTQFSTKHKTNKFPVILNFSQSNRPNVLVWNWLQTAFFQNPPIAHGEKFCIIHTFHFFTCLKYVGK